MAQRNEMNSKSPAASPTIRFAKDYLHQIPPKEWQLADLLDIYQRKHCDLTSKQLVTIMKSDLLDFAKRKPGINRFVNKMLDNIEVSLYSYR